MEQAILFGPQMEPSSDPVTGAPPLAVNAVWDGNGGFRRRRGLGSYDGAPSTAIAATAIQGLHLTANGHLLAVDSAVPARNVYDVGPSGASSLTGDGAGALRGSGRPVFAETEAIVAIAGGEDIVKVVLDASPLESSLLAGTQAHATHVVANNSRLLANNLTVRNRVNYSAPAAGSSYAGHEDWTTIGSAGYIASDARADYVTALLDSTNEVMAFGRRSAQSFSADSVSQYASVATKDFGCSAPYSAIRFDDGVGWLDHKRRIVLSDGRGIKVVSGPIQEELDTMASVEGCYVMELYQRQLAWKFADGRTFVLDRERSTWSLAMGWNTATNNFQAWSATSTCIRDDSGVSVIGTSDGKILKLERSSTSDDGTDIVMDLRTGFVSRGTSARKWCKHVRFMFHGGSVADGKALVSWRDGFGAWEPDVVVPLYRSALGGTLGVDLYSLGVYRARQWRLRYSGSEDIVFAGAFEEFEVADV